MSLKSMQLGAMEMEIKNLEARVPETRKLKEASERFGDPAFLDSLVVTD